MDALVKNPDSGDCRMSIFSSATSRTSNDTLDIEELVQSIRTPSPKVAETIRKAREAHQKGEEEIYDTLKRTLPAVTFSGAFTERSAAKIKAHSGLVGIDVDEIPPAEMAGIRASLMADPHCAFLFTSPSGQGLKGAFLIDHRPHNDAEHKTAFAAVRNYLKEKHGLQNDEKCSDVSRLAFVSHDPDCHHNPTPSPLCVEDWRDLTNEEKEVERLSQLLAQGYLGSIKTPPPPCPLILSTDDGRILGEAGNIVTIEGLMKTGKSAIISAIIGAAVAPKGSAGDFLGFDVPTKEGVVLHFDCEQSPKDHHRIIDTAVRKRAGLDEIPPTLMSHSFLRAPIEDRWPACKLAAQRLVDDGESIRMVIFDGGADFLKTLNDEIISIEMVHSMHGFAVEHSCVVVVVIHENPNAEGGKTRGHFGTELWRKCQSSLGVAKNSKDSISSVHGKYLREGDWPKAESHHFKFSQEVMMHISVDDPTEGRQEEKKKTAEAAKREELVELASKVMTMPVMTHTALKKAVMAATGRSERTAKARITELSNLGIIHKRGDGHYELSK